MGHVRRPHFRVVQLVRHVFLPAQQLDKRMGQLLVRALAAVAAPADRATVATVAAAATVTAATVPIATANAATFPASDHASDHSATHRSYRGRRRRPFQHDFLQR